MKQECPTYLKTIGKSKTLAATLSNTKPEDDSDNEDDGILNVFTATINPIEGIVEEVYEEEELVKSNFEKMDEQDDIYTAYAKLYKVSEKHEKMIGWPPRSLVMWSLSEKSFPQNLIKPIKLLEH